MNINEMTHDVIGAAIEVHKHLGPGLLESAYSQCLAREMDIRGISYVSELAVPIEYKSEVIDTGYRLDFLVNNTVIVELKSVEKIIPIHDAQLLSYLKLSNKQIGLLINFNVPVLKHGVKRIVNKL